MKISARIKAPVKVAMGESDISAAKLKKTETTLRKATKMKSVIRIVTSIVPLSWLKFAIASSTAAKFLGLKAY